MDLFRQKIKSQAAALSIFGQTLRPIFPKTLKNKFMKKNGRSFFSIVLKKRKYYSSLIAHLR